jgi:hypothetical protein
MGLKITNQIYTNKGLTEEFYINVKKINIEKNNDAVVFTNNYTKKADRDGDEMNTCQNFDIPNVYYLGLNVQNLEENYLYSIVYEKIKEQLVSKNLTVEDLQ